MSVCQLEPSIELSENFQVAPYNLWFPGQTALFRKAALDPSINFWSKVFDFNKEQGEHWSLLSSEDFPNKCEKTINGLNENENPVEAPRDYGGNLLGGVIEARKIEIWEDTFWATIFKGNR